MISPRALLSDELPIGEAIRSLPSLVANVGAAMLGVPSPTSPTFLSWAVTGRCQLKCLHCANDTMAPTLSKADRLEVSRRIADSGVRYISLIGGEPLLAPGVIDGARLMKEAGKRVSITTNAELLHRHLDDITEIGLDAVQISIDSHRPEQMDYLRARAGLFDRIMETLTELRSRRPRGKPEITVKCTISRGNVDELCEFTDFWLEHAERVHFQPVIDGGMNQVRDPSVMFQPEDEPRFRDAIGRLQERFPRFRNPYYSWMADYLFHTQELMERIHFSCLLVTSAGMFVYPDGSVSACYAHQDEAEALGTLRESPLSEVWRSVGFARARAAIREKSPECFCWDPNTLFNLYLLAGHNAVRWPLRALGFGRRRQLEPQTRTTT